MRWLVLGANGQLGQAFRDLAASKERGKKFIFWCRADLDLSKPQEFHKILTIEPDIVINCAAYTAVDRAESEQSMAKKINVLAVQRMGLLLAEQSIPIVHFSSDYVYHNYLRRPLRETDPCRPKGVYARTKFQGEQELIKSHPHPLIFRVSWLYGISGNNFPKTILRLAGSRDQIEVVSDQVGAPTYAKDVAGMVTNILDQYLDKRTWSDIAGVYNYCNTGQTNWYEIAKYVVARSNSDTVVKPIRSVAYPTAAPRPRYSVMDLGKFRRKFDLPVLHWRERLDDCLEHWINERSGNTV